jgi:hypothetical protein
MMALRWTAPEAMETLKFSMKTDVWAFGVVLLEICDNGDTPLKEFTNQQIMVNISSGYKAPKPPKCPESLYKVMCKCWALDPADRPSFAELVKLLREEDDLAVAESWGQQGALQETATLKTVGFGTPKDAEFLANGGAWTTVGYVGLNNLPASQPAAETVENGYVVQPQRGALAASRAASQGLYSQEEPAGFYSSLVVDQEVADGCGVGGSGAELGSVIRAVSSSGQAKQALYADGKQQKHHPSIIIGHTNRTGQAVVHTNTAVAGDAAASPRDAYIELGETAGGGGGAGMQATPSNPQDSYLVIDQGQAGNSAIQGGGASQHFYPAETSGVEAEPLNKSAPKGKEKKKKGISKWQLKQQMEKKKAGGK